MTTAVVLAGGLGTRLRTAVNTVPKPMAPINGRPFLEYLMDYWIGQGVKHFILSVGYKKDTIIDYFSSNYRSAKLSYVIEDEPLGTGGGLLQAAQGLSEPFILLNGDTFFEVSLLKLMKFHQESESDWTFSLFRSDEVGRYMGIEVNLNGEIRTLKSQVESEARLANGGVYFVNPSLLINSKFTVGDKLSLEEDLLPAFISQGYKLFGAEFSGVFIDIGIPHDYFRASKLLPT